MAMTTCHECGKDLSTTAESCPHCGARPPKPKKTKWWLWIPLGLVGAFMLVGLVGSRSPTGQAKANARSAISICWAEQSKKSLDAGSAQFVAGACERMEEEFQRKWNARP